MEVAYYRNGNGEVQAFCEECVSKWNKLQAKLVKSSLDDYQLDCIEGRFFYLWEELNGDDAPCSACGKFGDE